MATLIAVYSGDRCIGRCDEACYDAKHPACECICGSRNHSKGLAYALAHTRENLPRLSEWAAAWKAASGLAVNVDLDIGIGQDVLQPSLFCTGGYFSGQARSRQAGFLRGQAHG